MATLRLYRSSNACANIVTHVFGVPPVKAHSAISSPIFKATRTISTTRPTQTQPRHITISSSIRSHELRRTYASASPAQPAPSQNATPALNPAELLSWDQFLATRRRRRFANLGVSVACAIAAAIFGSPLIGEFDLDTKVAQATGIDPLGVIAAGSFAVAVAGWFAGRVLGGVLFSLWARQGGWSRIFAEVSRGKHIEDR